MARLAPVVLAFISLVPRPSLNLPAFNVVSWEIERGPGDEAKPSYHSTELAA
jgi:hypothetical protein